MEALQAYLTKHGITQASFAATIGVSQPTVWEWLHGVSRPSFDSLRDISEATGLSADVLLAKPKRRKGNGK